MTDTREWQDISSAPTLERVIVAGWRPRQGTTSGYWWFHEDCTDNNGAPMDHPNATHFVVLQSVLPTFPPAPQEKG